MATVRDEQTYAPSNATAERGRKRRGPRNTGSNGNGMADEDVNGSFQQQQFAGRVPGVHPNMEVRQQQPFQQQQRRPMSSSARPPSAQAVQQQQQQQPRQQELTGQQSGQQRASVPTQQQQQQQLPPPNQGRKQPRVPQQQQQAPVAQAQPQGMPGQQIPQQPQQQRLFPQQQQHAQPHPHGHHENPVPHGQHQVVPRPTVDSQYLTKVSFNSLAVSEPTKRSIKEVFGFEFCSRVQAEAIAPCLEGFDVLAKAKTGTGKTLAFGIPAVEKLLQHPQPGRVSVLVLSPTRELAQQIQVEIDKLLHFHHMESLVVYGGVKTSKHVSAIKRRVPEILIATPGRCLDLMTSEEAASLKGVFGNVQLLVLDEADNLLDMGFRPQLNRILACIPKADLRQTFLFSATFPADVADLAGYAMRKNYKFVDTVGEEVSTHHHVQQTVYVCRQEALLLQLYHVLHDHIGREPEYKVLVFFVTANLTALYAEMFGLLGLPVLEMHSRLTQSRRDKISDEFRAGSRVVMFSSDVSARGVDYPNISCVIQVGVPQSREQYIHRTGRTGRAGRDGEAALLLCDFEEGSIRKMGDLPIQRVDALSGVQVQAAAEGTVGKAMAQAWLKASESSKRKGYQSFLGYYKSNPLLARRPSEELVRLANHFATVVMGLAEPPELEAKTVGKMGLKGVPGLRVARGAPRPRQY